MYTDGGYIEENWKNIKVFREIIELAEDKLFFLLNTFIQFFT